MFVTAIHFYPSLIFAGNIRSLPLESSSVAGSSEVSSSIDLEYQTWEEVTDGDKHSSLLQHSIHIGRRKFCDTTLMFVGKARGLPLSGAPEMCFTRVDSGLAGKNWTRL